MEPILSAEPARRRSTPEQGAFGVSTDPHGVRARLGFTSAAERDRVLTWLSEGLRPGRPGRLTREFPLLFDEDTRAQHLWLDDAHGPVSFTTLWPASFRLGRGTLHTGLIANVFTDPRRRGEGLARMLLQRTIQLAGQREMGLLLLWSDLDTLYRPLGFTRAGEERLLVVDRDLAARAAEEMNTPQHLRITPARPSDWPEIERLRHERPCELELPIGALAAMQGIPDLDVRVAHNESGVQGFAMLGRGDDLKEVIHEYGGTPAAVLACCRSLLEAESGRETLFVLAAPGREPLAWALRRRGARVVRQPLAWMRIGAERVFASDLSNILGLEAAIEIERVATAPGETEALRLRSALGECTLSQQSLVDSVFGQPAHANADDLQAALRDALGLGTLARLPLPFHVAGLESI